MSDSLEASNEGCNCLFWQYADALANLASAYNETPTTDRASDLLLEAMNVTLARMKPAAQIKRLK